MNNWNHQLNVAHALTAYSLACYFDATTITYNTFIPNSLVLAAMTFVVLYRAKDFLTEQAIHFRLECSVVDRFWGLYLTIGFFHDVLVRC